METIHQTALHELAKKNVREVANHPLTSAFLTGKFGEDYHQSEDYRDLPMGGVCGDHINLLADEAPKLLAKILEDVTKAA